jgi:hypothetical protein
MNVKPMTDFLSTNTKEPFFTFIPTIGAHPAYKGHGTKGKGECFKGTVHPLTSPFCPALPSVIPLRAEGDPGYWSFYNNCTGSIYDWQDIKKKAPLRPIINAGNVSYPKVS